MHKTLFLTAAEQFMFGKLASSLRDGWDVQTEPLDCFESPRQIKMRYFLADFTLHPEMKVLAEKIEKQDLGGFTAADLPEGIESEVLFVLGARGVNALIESLLPSVAKDEEVEALATLSAVRHKLLEINSTATHF